MWKLITFLPTATAAKNTSPNMNRKPLSAWKFFHRCFPPFFSPLVLILIVFSCLAGLVGLVLTIIYFVLICKISCCRRHSPAFVFTNSDGQSIPIGICLSSCLYVWVYLSMCIRLERQTDWQTRMHTHMCTQTCWKRETESVKIVTHWRAHKNTRCMHTHDTETHTLETHSNTKSTHQQTHRKSRHAYKFLHTLPHACSHNWQTDWLKEKHSHTPMSNLGLWMSFWSRVYNHLPLVPSEWAGVSKNFFSYFSFCQRLCLPRQWTPNIM